MRKAKRSHYIFITDNQKYAQAEKVFCTNGTLELIVRFGHAGVM